MLKVGVIGLGVLGQLHVKHAVELPLLQVVAVCDHKLATAQQVAKQFQIPYFTNNIDQFFNYDAIDAVIVATSSTTHFDIVMKAISLEKPIFVEKPLTIDLAASHTIAERVNDTGHYCQVGFMRRFHPDYVEAKRLITSGAIGEPLYYKGISRDPEAPSMKSMARSGGIFIDLAIHDYDLAHFLMDTRITDVSASGSIVKYSAFAEFQDVDYSLTSLRFANGAAGDIESSRFAYYGYDVRTEIIGSTGTLKIGRTNEHNVSLLTKAGHTESIIPSYGPFFEVAYERELMAFANAVLCEQPSPVTVDDSVTALTVAYAATESYHKQSIIQNIEHKKGWTK